MHSFRDLSRLPPSLRLPHMPESHGQSASSRADPVSPPEQPRDHPRVLGWFGVASLAMGGSNQSLFLLGALLAAQGSAAIPLLILGFLLSCAAAPGWIELCLMWPRRVGGIAATCAEAFRPYSGTLANLTGMCYWWGWVPTCGLTAILSASAIHQWYLPQVPVTVLAGLIVVAFTIVNLCGVRWVARVAIPLAIVSASLAFMSCLVPALTGHVDWQRAASWHLVTPFNGIFGGLTSAMAGLYLIGFAAPAFEAALCHVGEMRNPVRDLPRAVFASGFMAGVYFLLIPVVWLGVFGPVTLQQDLAQTLGPVFAPLVGSAAKAFAVWFMITNMFHGTLQPLAGASRTLMQLSEDGLLPRILAHRVRRTDAPSVATLLTASMAIAFLIGGDPTWVIAAANLTYLIGIGLPNVAVWLLRKNAPEMHRPWRAPRGTIMLGVTAAGIWGLSTILGFEQFGLPTVIMGMAFAYSGSLLYAWRLLSDRRRAGLPFGFRSMHLKLTGAMLAVLTLDAFGYLIAISAITAADTAQIAFLQDIFVAVAILTITVGLVLPGMIAQATGEVARAADRLATGTLAGLTRAMEALADGRLAEAQVEFDATPVLVHTKDEIGAMAASFNTMQSEVARAAIALDHARGELQLHRDHLEQLVAKRTEALTETNHALETARYDALDREASFRVLFEGNPHPMWVFDATTLRFLAVNDAAIELYGWSRGEFLRMTVLDIRPDDQRGRFSTHMRDGQQRSASPAIWRHRLRSGEVIEVDVSSTDLTFESHSARLVLAQNITARVRLERELSALNEERRGLLARVVTAQEEERQSIAADIHDDAVQVMTAAKMRLDLLAAGLTDSSQQGTVGQLSEVVGLSIHRLRHLLFGLAPPALERFGLRAALVQLVDEWNGDSREATLDADLRWEPDKDIALIVYRIVQEALANVRKHAHATTVVVSARTIDDGLVVRVTDNGVGLPADVSADLGTAGHLGIAAMRERARMAGGTCNVTSAMPQGTAVECWVPLDPATPEIAGVGAVEI